MIPGVIGNDTGSDTGNDTGSDATSNVGNDDRMNFWFDTD